MDKQIAAGAIVLGVEGRRVAAVQNVALSPVSLQATWLFVLVDASEHVTAVPTATASVDGMGVVHVPFTRDQLLAAPPVQELVDEELGRKLKLALGLE